jgi:hypothetical protein
MTAGAAVVVALLAGAAACARAPDAAPDAAVPARTPDLRGTITRARSADAPQAPALVLVEEVPGGPGGAKASLTVPAGARVLRRAGVAVGPSGRDALRVGAQVEVWFAGPVAESYPVQATAAVVVVGP